MRNHREFDGGYARTHDIQALISAKEAGDLAKNELRLFFANLERIEAGKRVSIDLILNKKRKTKKRMTSGQQDRAQQRLSGALERHKSEDTPYAVKLPRKFVRTAARGAFDVSEMIVGLYYYIHRMPQRSRRKSLVKGERYSRMSVRGIEAATGLCKDVIVSALRNLRAMKVIALIWRPMVEIKRWGRLYVDGAKTSISYHKPERSRSCSPSARLPKTRTSTPINQNRDMKTLPNNSFNSIFNGKGKVKRTIADFAAKFCPDHQF